MKYSPEIESLIAQVAAERGIPASRLRAFIGIESGGNPGARTGSYKGLLQLSDNEFNRNGGGNIYNARDNLNAGAIKLQAEAEQFKRQYGREPTDADLYLIHQQGWGGAQAHWANPDQPAWRSMADTAEGRQKGEAWARKAIWGNIPDSEKAKYGSVDNVTSRDFAGLWRGKVERFGGNAQPTPEDRQGSINGGYGTSPTGAAGISGPIQTATPTGPEAVAKFNDFKPEKPKETLIAGSRSSSPIGGDADGLLSALFGKDGNAFQSMMSQASMPIQAPQPASIPVIQQRPVDPAALLAIVQRRQKLGSA